MACFDSAPSHLKIGNILHGPNASWEITGIEMMGRKPISFLLRNIDDTDILVGDEVFDSTPF